MLDSIKRCYPIIIATIFQIQSLSAFGAAIIGGTDTAGDPYAAFVDSSGTASTITGMPAGGSIVSAAINDSGAAIVGGTASGPYAAIVSPSGVASTITGGAPPATGWIRSVAINSSGTALVGGRVNTGATDDPYVVRVDSSGVATPLTGTHLPITPGQVNAVAINDSGVAIIGGFDTSLLPASNVPYAAIVSPGGATSALTGDPLPAIGWIQSVAINASGAGIIGGFSNSSTPYAALVSPIGVAMNITPLPAGGTINSVAINTLGSAIIGGSGAGSAYAALVPPSGVANAIAGLPGGQIMSVAINDSSAAIIGGEDGASEAYVRLVSPSGATSVLTGDIPPTGGGGVINSVAINSSGVALIGGYANDGVNDLLYGALVSPSGVATALIGPLPTVDGEISSVAINASEGSPGGSGSILSMVDPRSFGPGNAFANPIFALSTAVLENHLKRLPEGEPSNAIANLTADAQDIIRPAPSCQETPTYVLWGSPFGLYAHHKKGDSFPDLRDRSVGGIIGFDYLGWEGFVLGGGGAYAYQNIGYSNNFGKARVNQEFLTLYGAWHQKHIAIQGALWGGLYQMHNTRKTLGFISSTSHVNGWIFSPHVEISAPFQYKNKPVTIEPFVMFDWVNNWQGSVKEHGKSGLNIRIDSHYVSLLRSEVGLHLLQSCQLKRGDLTFEESFSYVNKTPFNAKRMSTYYVGSISTFNLQMFSNRTVNLGAVRFNARFTPCSLKPPYVYLSYQGEFGSNLLSHTVALEVGKRF